MSDPLFDTRNPMEREVGRIAGAVQQIEVMLKDLAIRLAEFERDSKMAHGRQDERVERLGRDVAVLGNDLGRTAAGRRMAVTLMATLIGVMAAGAASTIGWGIHLEVQVADVIHTSNELIAQHNEDLKVKRDDDEHLRTRLDAMSTSITTLTQQMINFQTLLDRKR